MTEEEKILASIPEGTTTGDRFLTTIEYGFIDKKFPKKTVVTYVGNGFKNVQLPPHGVYHPFKFECEKGWRHAEFCDMTKLPADYVEKELTE